MNGICNKNPKDIIGNTPLHIAAYNGQLEICRFIVQNVEDKNPKNHQGRTPLHNAAYKNQNVICELILQNIEALPRVCKGLVILSNLNLMIMFLFLLNC